MLWLSQFSSKIGKDNNNLNTLEELEFVKKKKLFKSCLKESKNTRGTGQSRLQKKQTEADFFSGMASFMSHCQLTKTLNQLFLANARLAFSSIGSKLLITRSLSAGHATFVPVNVH